MTARAFRGQVVAIEVRPVADPAGRPAVLLQLPDGFVVIKPDAARRVAARLTSAAAEADDPAAFAAALREDHL